MDTILHPAINNKGSNIWVNKLWKTFFVKVLDININSLYNQFPVSHLLHPISDFPRKGVD